MARGTQIRTAGKQSGEISASEVRHLDDGLGGGRLVTVSLVAPDLTPVRMVSAGRRSIGRWLAIDCLANLDQMPVGIAQIAPDF
jgi:hypothetical protein